MGSTREHLLRVIETLASEVAARRGVEVVEIIYRSQGKRSVLRVDIDRAGPPGVGLGDCEAFSRDLDPLLDDVEGLPESGYDLQVSSPGLDRPFRTDADFRRNVGRRVEIETREPVGGLRSLVGVLEGASPSFARVRVDDGPVVDVPRNSILWARQELGLTGGRRSSGRPGSRRARRGIV